MIVDFVLFVVGLCLIIKGADWLTDGASDVARSFGISTLVIGMTIVAVGSSMPEFVVSACSAVRGNTDMAIGNVVGSNIFNILSIIGVTALIAPITASHGNVRNDVPFVVLSSLVVAVAALDSYIGDSDVCEISRSEGLLMLCLFIVYLSYTFAIAKDNKNDVSQENDGQDNTERRAMWKSVLLIIVGLGMLIVGGDVLVDSASNIARSMNVSQSVIAITIVSAGTSLPELAASVMAARKGDTDMALGNIVGSGVFNVFFILGTSAVINPLNIGNITVVDLLTLIFASVLFWAFTRTQFKINKWEGLVLIFVQVVYYIYLLINAKNFN